AVDGHRRGPGAHGAHRQDAGQRPRRPPARAAHQQAGHGGGLAMEHRVRQLLAVNRAIAESLDYEALLELVVERTAELARAKACALLLADDGGLARVVASRGIPPDKVAGFATLLDER